MKNSCLITNSWSIAQKIEFKSHAYTNTLHRNLPIYEKISSNKASKQKRPLWNFSIYEISLQPKTM